MLLAHSENKEKGIPAQCYSAHVCNVISRATIAAKEAAIFSAFDGDLLQEIVRLAAEYHDLGKLDNENQEVLSGKKKAKSLPVQHTDAGTTFLLNQMGCSPGAVLIRSHHIGLPDFVEESNRSEKSVFRDDSVREHVDKSVSQLQEFHRQVVSEQPFKKAPDNKLVGNAPLFFRLALSCLVDGDHTDTAIHYGGCCVKEPPKLQAKERLAALDVYVEGLAKDKNDRSHLRSKMYRNCRDTDIDAAISSCDSPVGTGKTTAVMAHLLAQAVKRKLRRIFVILPFTNIITQSVKVYREALVLPGENPEEIVAELHHRADFQDIHTRHLTMLWSAPIVVTTAVSFFETLASNTPSTLRRLHNLPGSAVFIDESHAALPAKLLPLAWSWIKSFGGEWGCYWVLASGSLNRFWQIPEFDQSPPIVPEILNNDVRRQLSTYEVGRVTYCYKESPQSAEQLVEWTASLPGPRIVILNTVQSAAVVALACKERFGKDMVEHLSNALAPKDRERTLKNVKERLDDIKDTNWMLIATSCVEAGVNISFRTGIRELCSLVSLLQTAGRVNRHGEIPNAHVWTIRLAENGLLKAHPGVKEAAQVLKEYCEAKSAIAIDLCTDALKREIRLAGDFLNSLRTSEENMRFPRVEKEFRVISNDTRTVIVDGDLIQRLEQRKSVDWREIQNGSVQIWGYRLESMRIEEFSNYPGLYRWNYPYDEFIGHMAGILPIEKALHNSGGFIL